MSAFEYRMKQARSHEAAVMDALRSYAWEVDTFGQGQLSDVFHRVLRRIPTPLRWLPDIIAARDGVVVLVDAKTGRTDTLYHDLEKAALDAHLDFVDVFRIPIFYVWADFSVGTPEGVERHHRPGPRTGNGSGTPYVLTPRAAQQSFTAVFGVKHD